MVWPFPLQHPGEEPREIEGGNWQLATLDMIHTEVEEKKLHMPVDEATLTQ